MARLTRGTTYSSGSTVNATNLGQLISSATLSGVSRADINSSTFSALTYDTVVPSPTSLEVWEETGSGILLVWDSSASLWKPLYRYGIRVNAQVALSQGDVVRGTSTRDATNGYIRVRKAVSAESGREIGAMAADIAGGEVGHIVVFGYALVNVTGTVSAGDGLVMSTTGGVARAGSLTDGSDTDDVQLGGIRFFGTAMSDKDGNDQVVALLRR